MSDQESFHLCELIKLTYKFSRVLICASAPTDNRFINQNVHLVYSTVAPFQWSEYLCVDSKIWRCLRNGRGNHALARWVWNRSQGSETSLRDVLLSPGQTWKLAPITSTHTSPVTRNCWPPSGSLHQRTGDTPTKACRAILLFNISDQPCAKKENLVIFLVNFPEVQVSLCF